MGRIKEMVITIDDIIHSSGVKTCNQLLFVLSVKEPDIYNFVLNNKNAVWKVYNDCFAYNPRRGNDPFLPG